MGTAGQRNDLILALLMLHRPSASEPAVDKGEWLDGRNTKMICDVQSEVQQFVSWEDRRSEVLEFTFVKSSICFTRIGLHGCIVPSRPAPQPWNNNHCRPQPCLNLNSQPSTGRAIFFFRKL